MSNNEKVLTPRSTVIAMTATISAVTLLLCWLIIVLISQFKVKGDMITCIPFDMKFPLSQEARVMVLVMCAGCLGSFIHLITSFVTYVGDQKFERSWIIWYILRPFVGIAIAMVFYFALRGGFLSGSTSSEDLNIYGVLTISGLAGMFSKQATEKLNELFSTLFRTQKREKKEAEKEKDSDSSPVG